MTDMTSIPDVPLVRHLAADAQLVTEIPKEIPRPEFSSQPNFVAEYPYHTAEGALTAVIVRYEQADESNPRGRQKKIIPHTCWRNADGTYNWARKNIPDNRPLYHLGDLIARPDAMVILSEGEKCADAAKKAFSSCVSVTWMGGTNALQLTDFAPLAGRDVMILPDHDDPGRKAATSLLEILKNHGVKSAKVLNIEALGKSVSDAVPQGYDIADAISDGLTSDYLFELLKTHPDMLLDIAWPTSDGSKDPTPEAEVVDPVLAHLERNWDMVPELPEGFVLSEDGIFKHGTGSRGAPSATFAGSPLAVVGRTHTDPDGAGWGFFVTFKTPRGDWETTILPARLLAGDGKEMREVLAQRGYICPQDRAGRQALAEYIAYAKSTELIEIVSRPGWIGDSFALPQRVIAPPESGRRVTLDMQDRIHFFATAGTPDAWAALAKLAEKSSRAAFVLAVAFAGPLLKPLGEGGGGFHLYGLSSRGKTTLLRLAGSVWGGGGRDGFVRNWRMTDNGVEGIAADHNDVLIALDELTMVSPDLAADLYYMLANGHGKVRATKTGTARASAQWQAMALSSGEDTSAAHIRSGSRGAQKRMTGGLAVRMVDIPIEPAPGQSFEDLAGFTSEGALAEHISHQACEVYGYAGPAFIGHLIEDQKKHLATARMIIRAFVDAVTSSEDDPQVHRVAKRFGLVAAAGTLAADFGVLPWQRDSAFRAAVTCYEAWKEKRGTTRSEEERDALRALREFFELHGASRFEPFTPKHFRSKDQSMLPETPLTIRDRCGYRTVDREGNVIYYVTSEAFHSQVCGQHSSAVVLQVARDRGALIPGDGSRHQTKVRLPDYPEGKRVYGFLLHKLS